MTTPCNTYDHLQRRCPRLGGPVTFRYCRQDASDDGTCSKVFDCWWERFDVVAFFRQQLTVEAFDKLKQTSMPDKVTSLVDIVRRAQENITPSD